jgi:hypothetical protein
LFHIILVEKREAASRLSTVIIILHPLKAMRLAVKKVPPAMP